MKLADKIVLAYVLQSIILLIVFTYPHEESHVQIAKLFGIEKYERRFNYVSIPYEELKKLDRESYLAFLIAQSQVEANYGIENLLAFLIATTTFYQMILIYEIKKLQDHMKKFCQKERII